MKRIKEIIWMVIGLVMILVGSWIFLTGVIGQIVVLGYATASFGAIIFGWMWGVISNKEKV